jgi:hypothetical protein
MLSFKYYIFLLYISSLSSCISDSKNTKKDIPEISQNHIIQIANAFKKKKEISLSSLTNQIKYIPLETNKKILIKRIDQLFITKNYYIISDRNRCYLFNKQGKFIRFIGKYGKGPKEFCMIRSIDVNEATKCIYICPNYKRVIYQYDFNGNFIKKYSNNLDISQFIFIDSTNYMLKNNNYHGDSEFDYTIVDEKKDTINKFRNYVHFDYSAINRGSVLSRNRRCFLVRNTSSIYAKSFFNDTIFQIISPKKRIAKYILNCENLKLPYELLGNNPKYYQKKSNFLIPSNISLNSNYTFAKIEYQKKEYGSFYSQKTKKTYFLPYFKNEMYGFTNDIDKGLPFWPFTCYKEKQLIGYFLPYQLLDYMKEHSIKSENLQYLNKKINENDNPVLVLVNIKEDCKL